MAAAPPQYPAGSERRTVTLHRAEVIEVEAESYRLKEAKELRAARSKQRRPKKG